VGGYGGKARGCDMMVQKIYLRLSKLALGWVNVEAIFSKNSKDSVKMA
jgi:hypothetical protein